MPAEVHFNPNRLAHVTPLRLHALGISAERRLLEARQELAEATADRDAARAKLGVMGAGRRGDVDDVIRAPIDGTVVERHAARGEYVRPEDKLFVVGDLREVWVLGRVPEREVGGVDVSDTALIALEAYPGRTWRDEVDYVASRADEGTRTLQIRADVTNEDRALRPGFFGTMQIIKGDGKQDGGKKGDAGATLSSVTLVPEGAVQELEGKSIVFVPVSGEEGRFRVVPVEVGEAAFGTVPIRRGLKSGQPVVVEGAFVLKSQPTST